MVILLINKWGVFQKTSKEKTHVCHALLQLLILLLKLTDLGVNTTYFGELWRLYQIKEVLEGLSVAPLHKITS